MACRKVLVPHSAHGYLPVFLVFIPNTDSVAALLMCGGVSAQHCFEIWHPYTIIIWGGTGYLQGRAWSRASFRAQTPGHKTPLGWLATCRGLQIITASVLCVPGRMILWWRVGRLRWGRPAVLKGLSVCAREPFHCTSEKHQQSSSEVGVKPCSVLWYHTRRKTKRHKTAFWRWICGTPIHVYQRLFSICVHVLCVIVFTCIAGRHWCVCMFYICFAILLIILKRTKVVYCPALCSCQYWTVLWKHFKFT